MAVSSTLSIKQLYVTVEDKEILRGVSLDVPKGEIHAIMGPNGSGKSTLANTIMGHPSYEVTGGSVHVDDTDVLDLGVNERAKAGLFLSFQYPVTIAGVPLVKFLHTAYNELHWNGEKDRIGRKVQAASFTDFYQNHVVPKMELLGVPKEFAERSVNDGLSGGEKKKSEILQLAVLQPQFAILDETDSGLDIDSIRVVANGVRKVFDDSKGEMGVLIITHYQRILEYLKPDRVHVMIDGKIVKSGGKGLVEELEDKGYEGFK